MINRLIPVSSSSDILPAYRDTPIAELLEFHNLNKPFQYFETAQLLIGMCMDNRKYMHIPDNFAFIIRSGGANLRYSEFKVSFAISVGKVHHIALIGHNHCGMVNLASKKEEFVKGLVENAGWEPDWASEHFNHFAPMYEVGNEVDFILSETIRLRIRYPKIQIAPLMYLLEDNRLYFVEE